MNIVITGASKGIGYALSQVFLEDPNNRVFALSRDTKPLFSLKQEATNGANLTVQAFDITQYDTGALVALLQPLGHLDILVNNAGALINKPFMETSAAEWQQIFDVNLFGPAQLIRDLVPLLSKAESPHIVNIGSMGGVQGSMKFPGLSAYSASKAALANLTECLAEELKETNIAVNCLCLVA